MNKKALLCLDTESLLHPFLIGLPDERLDEQPWLGVCCDAQKARLAVFSNKELKVVWVVSSDTVAGINLAAALRKDNPFVDVYYVTFDMTGSVLSRCRAASVKPLNKTGFMHAYSSLKSTKKNNQYEEVKRDQKARTFLLSEESEGDKSKPHNEINQSQEEKLRAVNCSLGEKKDELDLEESPNVFPQFSLEKRQEAKKDISLLREQMKLGDSEVLRNTCNKKSEPMADKGDRLKKALVLLKEEQKGCVLSVFSGSGGSGKSTISAMLGLAAVDLGFKTVILDADFQFGDMAFLLGLNDQTTVQDIIENPERIHEVMNHDALPSLIASPKNLEYSEVASKQVSELLVLLRSQYEVIVVNTGAFWCDLHAQLLENSDKSLFLIDQRPSSVRSCSHALSLCARCGIATQNFVFALNRCSRQALLTSIDVSCALKGVRVHELKDGGKEVGELLAAGLPRELTRGRNVFYEGLKEFAQEIIPLKKKSETSNTSASDRSKTFRLIRRKRRAACL